MGSHHQQVPILIPVEKIALVLIKQSFSILYVQCHQSMGVYQLDSIGLRVAALVSKVACCVLLLLKFLLDAKRDLFHLKF